MIYLSLLLLVAALVTAFLAWRWSALTALAGLLLAWLLMPAAARAASPMSVVILACTALLVTVLAYMLPADVARSRRGVAYLVGGALTGACIGCLLPSGWLVITIILAAALAAYAYGNTPAGRALLFPTPKYWRYILAKGFPAVVTVITAATGALLAYEYLLLK